MTNQVGTFPQQGQAIGCGQLSRLRDQLNARKNGHIVAVNHPMLGITSHPLSLSREKEPRHGPEIHHPF